jgi:hypothetical protein
MPGVTTKGCRFAVTKAAAQRIIARPRYLHQSTANYTAHEFSCASI